MNFVATNGSPSLELGGRGKVKGFLGIKKIRNAGSHSY